MKSLLLKWLVNSIALYVVVKIAPGISIQQWQTLFVAALVLGLLNAFLKPVIVFLTIPVNFMTLGLFTLVINGLMFYLAAWLVTGLHVAGFWSAFLAALLFSIASFLLNLLFKPDS